MANSEEHSDLPVHAQKPHRRAGRINYDRIRSTTEAEITLQKIEDNHPGAEDLGPVRVVVGGPNVSEVRAKFQLSQEAFAERFGLSLRTLQQWEQKRRIPDGPAKLLLRIIEQKPDIVEQIAHH